MPYFAACAGGAIATWDYAAFTTAYPAFASAPAQATLQAYFTMAGAWLRNDGTGPVRDQAQQQMLMFLLTAHLAQIFNGPDGTGASGIVGRISSATEGSVTVAAEMETTLNSAWFSQTPYGAAFWQLTAAYRTFARYIPGPLRFGNGIGTFGPRGRRGY
jgi:hypothetical protein